MTKEGWAIYRNTGEKRDPRDEMTPRERMLAFWNGQAVDRLPCCPSLGETSAPLCGVKMSDYYHSPTLMAAVELEVFRQIRPDSAGIGIGLRGIPEAMGVEFAYPDYGLAYVKTPLIKDCKEMGRLKIIDPWRDGSLPSIIKANQLIHAQIGDEVGVGSGIAGPLTVAAALRGTESLLKDMYRNPPAVHTILEIATENCLRYIDAVCSLGLGTGIGDPVASASIISVKHFREYARPYLAACHERIKKWTGSGGRLHICGRTRELWPLMVDCGAAILSIDNIEDLEEARSVVGDRVCLMGNIDPVNIMKNGKPEDICTEVETCVRKAGFNPRGYIISTGCQVPIGTPLENLTALMDAARLHGRP